MILWKYTIPIVPAETGADQESIWIDSKSRDTRGWGGRTIVFRIQPDQITKGHWHPFLIAWMLLEYCRLKKQSGDWANLSMFFRPNSATGR